MRRALLAGLDKDKVNSAPDVDAIVLYRSEDVFSYDADIREFVGGAAGWGLNLPTLIRSLEASHMPVVAVGT